MILLVHPPAVKPCEPPAGIAGIAAVLKASGIPVRIMDANLEGVLALLEKGALPAAPEDDAWTRRARRLLPENLNILRDPGGYRKAAEYRRAVSDLNRILEIASPPGTRADLSNYRDETLSPLRSRDLLLSAAEPERNAFYPYFRGRLDEEIHGKGIRLVGFSLNYLSQALTAFAMAGYVRSRYPETRLIFGGGLVTSWVRRSRDLSRLLDIADHLVAGPGEETVLRLCGGAGAQERRTAPDYSGFPLGRYLAPGRILPYSASRGCYWRKCSFCPENAERQPYQPVSDRNALEEVSRAADGMAPMLIHFLDNAVRPSLLQALVRRPPGVPWYGFARITDHLARPDFCRDLRRSGCRMLQLGLESGDQRVLDALGKGVDLQTASLALKNLKEAGIATYVYLLFGTPEETEESARRTLSFVASHGDCIDFINAAIFNLPFAPGETPESLATMEFYDGDLSLYRNFIHPQGWDRKSVRRFLEREFGAHPAVRPIILRDPPSFTSNHAPFFAVDRDM